MLDDFKLFKKSYDLLLWIYPTIKKFPKSDKYTLGENIKKCILNIISNIICFCKYKNKLLYLNKIDLDLEKLRIFFRISKDIKILSFKKYDFVELQINELGNIVGGLLKKNEFLN